MSQVHPGQADRLDRRLIILTIIVFFILLGCCIVAWITSPLMHWLWFDIFYLHPAESLFWVIAVIALGWSIGRAIVGDSLWPFIWCFLPVLTYVIFFQIWAGSLIGSKLVGDLQPEQLSALPNTTAVRWLPYEVAVNFGKNKVNDSTVEPGGFEPFIDGQQIDMVAPRVPNGFYNAFAAKTKGIIIIRPDGSANVVGQEFRYGEGMQLRDNIRWIMRRHHYWSNTPEVYYLQQGQEVLEVVPYMDYHFSFPVMVPYWGGVTVFHPDGRMEELTPSEAVKDPRFAGQRLFPLSLAKQMGEAWDLRGGVWNQWFNHRNQTQIPDVSGGGNNPQPYLVPSQNGPQFVMAAEASGGNSHGVYKILYFNAHNGVPSEYTVPNADQLIGPNASLTYIKSSYPQLNWKSSQGGNIIPLEPRPVIKDGALYWMSSVTTTDYAGIACTVLVDSRSGKPTAFNQLDDLKGFLSGTAYQPGTCVSAGANVTVGNTATGFAVGSASDEQLSDMLRQIANEQDKRRKR